MVVKRLLCRLPVLLVCFLPVVAGAELTAKFDRDSIHINETARLVIESDGGRSETPDLSPLEKHFKVLGQSTRQNISIVNGQRSTVIRYILDLVPRQEGSFSIAPIRVGNESTPIMRITVLPEKVASGQTPDIFIDTEVDQDTVYVQQQLRLTVRLYVDSPLLEGRLEDPEPPSTRVEPLGEVKRYQSSRGGRDYLVYERNYALFPQQSGDLEIPPIRFQGLLETQQSSGLQFGYSGRPVRTRSGTIRVAVKPPNPRYKGKIWLPVPALQIDEVGDIQDQGEAGQPFTRKIQVQAKGLTADHLPELRFDSMDGVRIYPDKPVRDTAIADGKLVAIQQNNVAVIASRAGTITLPAIEIDWWNTVTDKPEKAVLPARTVEILPPPGSVAARPDPATETPSAKNDVTQSTSQAGEEDSKDTAAGTDLVWKPVALAAMGLWGVTLVALVLTWRRRGQTPKSHRPENPMGNAALRWRNELKKACRDHDPVAARRALAGWLGTRHDGNLVLEDWVTAQGNPELADALHGLDRHLYAPGGESGQWKGDRLWTAWAGLSVADTENRDSPGALLPLYPGPAGNQVQVRIR